MAVKERQAGSVTVLTLSGRITIGAGSEELDDKIKAILTSGAQALLLDCSAVEKIDTQGLQAIVRGFTELNERGGALKLLKLPPRVREVLRVTRLIEHIESFEDEEKALESFATPAS